ncbi:MAG: rRNA methyltransferase [Rariglobus sp.]|nr:rRNA methyltransferase [Rariglobus sp.]
MNLVLFESAELAAPLPRIDPRAHHILDVLRRREGDTFDAGVVNGPRGKATLTSLSPDALTLAFAWDAPLPPPAPTTLLIGLPRPQTARDILRDATTLGATRIHFVVTERADPNYAASTLWTSGEWRRHCLAGAAQAFATHLPEVTWTHTLATALATIPATTTRLALDNYEASTPLRVCHLLSDKPGGAENALVLAVGPERGWAPADRTALRANGFTLVHLGPRVLRVETAVVAALAITRLG